MTGEPNECGVVAEADLVSDRYALYLDDADMRHAYYYGRRQRPWPNAG
jgi:hypothetical protein